MERHSVTKALLDAVDIRRGADVLDLATGPGGAGLAAAERVGTFGSVILADVAREMVRVAVRQGGGARQDQHPGLRPERDRRSRCEL